jgi:abortive infection bacteriophage resistance protein
VKEFECACKIGFQLPKAFIIKSVTINRHRKSTLSGGIISNMWNLGRASAIYHFEAIKKKEVVKTVTKAPIQKYTSK